jgi:hypothetical protein
VDRRLDLGLVVTFKRRESYKFAFVADKTKSIKRVKLCSCSHCPEHLHDSVDI